MNNPTAAGWYWVWRLSKDIDRNIKTAMYWGPASDWATRAPLGTGWHDPDDMTFTDGGQPHTKTFAAWSGPLADPVPPECHEDAEAQYARSRAAARRAAGGSGIVLTNPEVFADAPVEYAHPGRMPCYKCAGCGQTLHVGFGGFATLPYSEAPWRYCPACGSELGEKPPDPKPDSVGLDHHFGKCVACRQPAREAYLREYCCAAGACRDFIRKGAEMAGRVHVKGCELGENWKGCPACVAARAAESGL